METAEKKRVVFIHARSPDWILGKVKRTLAWLETLSRKGSMATTGTSTLDLDLKTLALHYHTTSGN